MSDLTASHLEFLKHLNNGGLASICSYGKHTITTEVICKPKSYGAGIKSISYLSDLGFVRYGDPSPYKSGTSRPLILTDAGKSAMVGVTI
jgi:hypothetical protein